MNLIDKYTAEVGNRLPSPGRADIEAEIRSTLQDILDDRSRQTGQPIDETMIKAMLKEYGSPAKVAATYQPPQYLIGPRLYPNFEMVLKIVLAVLFGVALLQLGLSMASNASGPAFAGALGQFGSQLFGSALTAFANIVLIFAILDRVLSNKHFEKEESQWDPGKLAELPDRDAIKPFDLIASVVFGLIGLAVLNLYSDKIGLVVLTGDQWRFAPILTENFFRYLPWINGLGVVQIAFNLALLRRNAWSLATRLMSLAIRAAGMALALVMLTGPAMISISTTALAGTALANSAEPIARGVNLGVTIGLVVAVVVGLIEVIQSLYRLMTRRSSPAFPAAK